MGPRLVGANCPHCGGAMNLVAGQPIAQCSYCGKSSFVHVPGRPDPPPPMQPPPAPYGHIYLQHDPTAHTRALDGAAKTMKWVFVLTGLGVLVPAVIAVVATTGVTRGFGISIAPKTEVAPDDDDEPAKSKRAAKEAAKPKLAVANLRRVEVSSVLEQGLAIARKEDPRFALTSAQANNLRGGFVDLTTDGRVLMRFELYALDPKLPPGQNVVSKRLTLMTEAAGTLRVTDGSGPGREVDAREQLPVPKCSSEAMWAAAVASGVAPESVATVHLQNDNRSRGPNLFVWSVRVEGYDKFRREIDAANCSVVTNWAKR